MFAAGVWQFIASVLRCDGEANLGDAICGIEGVLQGPFRCEVPAAVAVLGGKDLIAFAEFLAFARLPLAPETFVWNDFELTFNSLRLFQ